MQVDYAIELGGEDPALELPWTAEDGSARFYDLKSNPDLVLRIPEAVAQPELSIFLSRVNAADFPLLTAKCDTWSTRELSPEEKIFGAENKFGSYVDLVFTSAEARVSLERHRALAQSLCDLLVRAPEIAAAAELIIRHCHFHKSEAEPAKASDERSTDRDAEDSVTGFCITAYVSGFGDHEDDAHRHWTIGLKLLQNALVQVAARMAGSD